MAVEISKTGSAANPPAIVTIRVILDVTDVLSDGTLTAKQKRKKVFDRVVRELADSAGMDEKTDAEIDAQRDAVIADATAEALRLKALRPTGTI